MKNNDTKYSLITSYLVEFLRNEVEKTGLSHVVVGLSGGLDSAVVALLAKRAFKNNLLCVLMPSQYSSKGSIDDATTLCKEFNLKSETISIEPLLKSYSIDKNESMRIGNFSARMRMSILYDISAKESALVLGTSNKSEIMLGYGTIFGDLASAINPLGDLYKTEVYELARHLGVVDEIISKPPSADLYEGQSDELDLGYSYEKIDEVLKLYVDGRVNEEELIAQGFEPELIKMLKKRIYQNQFKRKPPVIAKLTSRSVNHDFLYPRDINL